MDLKNIEAHYEASYLGSTSLGDFKEFVSECVRLGVGKICVPAVYLCVRDLTKVLVGSRLGIVASIGTGTETIQAKIADIVEVEQYAEILDIALNVDLIRMEMWDVIHKDVIEIALHTSSKLRFVIEVTELTDSQIIRVFDIVSSTSAGVTTGMCGLVSVYHIELLKQCIINTKKEIELKASGKIRNKSEIIRMFDAGADVVGASSNLFRPRLLKSILE